MQRLGVRGREPPSYGYADDYATNTPSGYLYATAKSKLRRERCDSDPAALWKGLDTVSGECEPQAATTQRKECPELVAQAVEGTFRSQRQSMAEQADSEACERSKLEMEGWGVGGIS